MKNKNETSEYPVFPVDEYLGMSKRFYAAVQIAAKLSDRMDIISEFDRTRLVRFSYLITDELLKQEYGEQK